MFRSFATTALVLLVLGASPVLAADVPAADSTAMDWSRVPEYRIVPGDKLILNFGLRADGLEDYQRELIVRIDGRITVYPVGDVVAAGRTPMELEQVVTTLLAADLKAPRVTVEVAATAGNQVHVMGRVDKPGSFAVAPFMTVMQAITAAGGFKDDAARNSVLVFHRDGARTVRVTRVRVDRLLRGDEFGDLMLNRFDIVYVPRSAIGNIDVFARQFFGDTQAIVQTGLLGWELFNLDRVFVTRVVN